MAMPKILCGPILRRTEKSKVSIWIAFSRNYGLDLKVYEGDNIKVKANPDSNSEIVSIADGVSPLPLKNPATAVTVRFGMNLWIAVISAEPVVSFVPGKIYSYNINFREADVPFGKGDFRTDGLLKDGKHEERPQKAIGYATDVLPTFVLPSDDVSKLFIAHSSCRKLHGHGADALANLDAIIKKSVTGLGVDPFKRPAQLYLTGDQIYADDVCGLLLNQLGKIDGNSLVGQETVQIKPNDSATVEDIEADTISFPPLLRGHLIKEYAGFSTGSRSSHLISFEEYCGAYLNYWSVRSWSVDFVKEMETLKSFEKSKAEKIVDEFYINPPPDNTQGLIPVLQSRINDPSMAFVFKDNPTSKDDNTIKKTTFDGTNNAARDQWKKDRKKSLVKQLKEMSKLLETIPLIARVMANTPTYMIFDDHEITDDWNLSQRWQNQVLSKPLGRDIIRNGLMAYTVFQDWGNQPDEYVAVGHLGEDENTLSSKSKLIRKISDYGDHIATSFQLNNLRNEIINPIETHFGMGDTDGDIDWHYKVDCGPTQAIVLDTRTQRLYPSLNSPPGLIKPSSIDDQVPNTKPFGNAPFTFVVSAAPYFGLQSFEELIQPMAASIVGMTADTKKDPGLLAGQLKFDFEAWGMNKTSFQKLLEKLANLENVILLSGDVHYGFSSVMDLWEGNDNSPKARLVQLTASSLKNEEYGIFHLYRSALAEKLITGIGNNLEAMVWKNKVLSVTGVVSIRNRVRLRNTPAVLPIAGWQPGATISQDPDYRYRLRIHGDSRVREDDLIKTDIDIDNANSLKEGYKLVVQRSQKNFISGVHRRMVWPTQVGLVKFEKDGSDIKLKHEFLFKKGSRDIGSKDVKTYIIHEIDLEASGDDLIKPEL